MKPKEILDAIGEAAALEQLAEESAELTKAALKAARKLRDENPTPKAMPTIKYELNEEIADTLTALRVVMETEYVNMGQVRSIRREKIQRWADRINDASAKRPKSGPEALLEE